MSPTRLPTARVPRQSARQYRRPATSRIDAVRCQFGVDGVEFGLKPGASLSSVAGESSATSAVSRSRLATRLAAFSRAHWVVEDRSGRE